MPPLLGTGASTAEHDDLRPRGPPVHRRTRRSRAGSRRGGKVAQPVASDPSRTSAPSGFAASRSSTTLQDSPARLAMAANRSAPEPCAVTAREPPFHKLKSEITLFYYVCAPASLGRSLCAFEIKGDLLTAHVLAPKGTALEVLSDARCRGPPLSARAGCPYSLTTPALADVRTSPITSNEPMRCQVCPPFSVDRTHALSFPQPAIQPCRESAQLADARTAS